MTGARVETAEAPRGYELGDALDRAGDLSTAEHYLMLVLLQRYYDWRARCIPPAKMPSINELLSRTRYTSRTTIREALFRLETKGWITRRPPPQIKAQQEHARTAYVLHIPGSAFFRAIREAITGPDHAERRRRWAEIVRGGVARKRAAPAAAAAPAAWWDTGEVIAAAAAELTRQAKGRQLAELDQLARKAAAAVLEGKAPEHVPLPATYVRTAIANQPARYLPVSSPPRRRPSKGKRPAAESADATAKGGQLARELLAKRPRLASQPG